MKVINLKRASKQRARDQKRVASAQRAVDFGRPKAERARNKEQLESARKQLDAHKREE